MLMIVTFGLLTKGLALETTTFTTDEGAVLNITLSSVGNTATVTGMQDIANFKGLLSIPLEIAYNGSSYSIVTIADEAFRNGNMTAVTLGNVTTIGASAFRNCSSIQSLDLSNVKIIGDYAFYMKGSALKSLVFSGSLQSVGSLPFSSSVTQVTVNVESLMQINGLPIPTFNNADVKYYVNGELLTDIIIPKGESSISGFNQIKGLGTISFPSTTKSISGFNNTTAASVYCYAVTPPELTGLAACYDVPLYVPYKREFAYKMADGWKNFTNILEMEGEEIPECGDTITLTEAGTLLEALALSDKSEITNLVIRGKINAADIKVLRNASDKLATLDTLDISMVELVPSAEPYYIYTTMSDGSMNSEYHRFFISAERRDTAFMEASLSSWPPHYYDHYDYNLTAAFCSTRFKRIVMPRNISDIGVRTFMGCVNLNEVVMSNAPTSIGQEAFRDCKSLVLLPEMNKVEFVDEMAFYNCAQLGLLTQARFLDLSSAVTISDQAFYGCKKIQAVGFSDRLYSIGGYAFYNCTSLTDVSLSPNLVRLSYDSFENTPWLTTNKEVVDGITYLGTVAIELDRNMSAFSPREGTLGIADMFHHPGAKISTIQLPSSLKYIGKLSLREINLATIQLPDSLECIGERAFEGWPSLKEIMFPASLKEIGRMSFNSCGLESVIITDGVEEVGYRAFYDNQSLKKVYYGAKRASGTYIFNACYNIEEVIIGNKVKSIPSHTFEGKSLKSLVFGEELEIVEDNAFSAASEPLRIVLPPSLRRIGQGAFGGMAKEIIFSEGLLEIGANAFSNSAIEELNLPEGLIKLEGKRMGGAFSNCHNLRSVTLPSTLKEIGDYTFSNCNNLTQVISKIDIPYAISDDVFSNSSAFNNTLYVPKGTISLYQSTTCWNKFANIVEISNENAVGSVSSNSVAPAKYYNMSGIKTNGQRGLNIIRYGDGTVKKVPLPPNCDNK